MLYELVFPFIYVCIYAFFAAFLFILFSSFNNNNQTLMTLNIIIKISTTKVSLKSLCKKKKRNHMDTV